MKFISMYNRRSFIQSAAKVIALAPLAAAAVPIVEPVSPALNTPTVPALSDKVKQIKAGELNVGYVDEGPRNGPVVLLLHGWPYDINSFAAVVPILNKQGYRTIVPYLRGYGTTTFLSDQAMHNGQQSVFAVDAIALLDALQIDQAIVAGFDWGARTACILAALWPKRFKALVAVSGYLVGNQTAGKQPLPPAAELQWWYQFYFATERGRVGYTKNTAAFAKLIWQQASPTWKFDDATFNTTAAALNNPAHVDIVVHNYRWRMGIAEGDRKYDALEQQLAAAPAITIPTITIEGDANGAPHPDASNYAAKFTGKYSHKVFNNTGHNPPQESPAAFAAAIIEVAGYAS